MNKLVDALNRFSGKYLRHYRDRMPIGHLKALSNFTHCRTEAYGKFVGACTGCGLIEESYGACRNRACPKCNNSGTSEWIEKAKARLPNTSYFHMVFTVPSELHSIGRRNQKVFYEKLMAAVGETLTAFGASRKWVHGRIGFMTFLHTWDSKLNFHPHVHVLAMGGYLDEKGDWVAVQRGELFPARALSKRFKTVFLKSLRQSLGENIPSTFWKLPWVVYSKKTFPGTQSVIEYLGRYVKKIGIGASRLLRVDKKGVVLKYRHRLGRESHEFRSMRLTGEEFMRRYLQHVLPKGFVRLRYCGLVHPYFEKELARIRGRVATEVKEEIGTVPPVKACRECQGPLVEVARQVPSFFTRRKKRRGNSIYRRERGRAMGKKGGASPHNKLIEPIARGRHVACGASAAPVPAGRVRTGLAPPPCSRLISTLYGRGSRHATS